MTKKNTAADKRRDLRNSLWENADLQAWNRKEEKGFCTVPRTLPLIMSLIDALSGGKRASQVYLGLWCRAFDEGLVDGSDEEALAFEAGFVSNRSVRTWQERMRILEKWGFILIKPNGTKKYGHILLVHPHKVVIGLKAKGEILDNWWGAFMQRVNDIGCKLPSV